MRAEAAQLEELRTSMIEQYAEAALGVEPGDRPTGDTASVATRLLKHRDQPADFATT